MNRAYYNRTISIDNFPSTLQEFVIDGLWKLYIEIIYKVDRFHIFLFRLVHNCINLACIGDACACAINNYDYIALFEIMGFYEEGVGHIGIGIDLLK